MSRLEGIRALLEHRQPLLSTGLSHYPGCEAEHIDCAAWKLLGIAEAAAALKNDVDANEGKRWPHLWQRLEAALDKFTVEMPA